jgi:RNA polymerase sigma factor (sigma-70 family)
MPVKELIELRKRVEDAAKSDRDLVRGCLQNREEDWNFLVDKYKNLIFSIPLRYGFSREEAADIFQAVCLELIQELPKLRDAKALPKWLMQVTAHKCFHHKRESERVKSPEDQPGNGSVIEPSVPAAGEINVRELEQEQMLREALSGLSPRCRELIQMLFYEEPKRPYLQVAASLGLATGSIGLLRQKCLDCLKKRLEDLGFA